MGTETELGFDPAALRERYRLERDKRLRPDGNDQYVQPTGELGHLVVDPHADPEFRRPALTDEVDVVVVGGGFGGLLVAVRLREAGIGGVRIIESAADFGGTWYWNRFPGAACDIESYIYLPLLEETGYLPVEKYSSGAEILAYSRMIGERFDLYRDACFQTEVTELRWDGAADRWVVHTDRGDRIRARFVVTAGGPLHRPKLPGIPGLDAFAGHSFHTSRWDYGYTGPAESGMPNLADKRVGIIGTGATAIQCVPHLAASAERLYVFQRTPSSVDVRANRPTDPEWAASLTPGWQRDRMDNFNILVSGGFQEKDLVGDGWTDIIRHIALIGRSAPPGTDPLELIQLADFRKMEQIRGRVHAVVRDPEVAEALKPYYNQFCKRPCFHDGYLDAFNRPNVTLVDTDGRGVGRVTPAGVVACGREYPLDCLIYATGFEVGTGYTRRVGFEIYGRDGISLTERWAQAGPVTLHGLHVNGFPNYFIVSNLQSGFAPNFPHMLGEQAVHLAYLVKHCVDNGIATVEATREAEDAWVDTILKASSGRRRRYLESCTPGYYNNEGRPDAMGRRSAPFGGSPVEFIRLLEQWRAEGSLAGLRLARR
jgi:cation diffusion facilitator CzcD-associated flavoprotein CzcO